MEAVCAIYQIIICLSSLIFLFYPVVDCASYPKFHTTDLKEAENDLGTRPYKLRQTKASEPRAVVSNLTPERIEWTININDDGLFNKSLKINGTEQPFSVCFNGERLVGIMTSQQQQQELQRNLSNHSHCCCKPRRIPQTIFNPEGSVNTQKTNSKDTSISSTTPPSCILLVFIKQLNNDKNNATNKLARATTFPFDVFQQSPTSTIDEKKISSSNGNGTLEEEVISCILKTNFTDSSMPMEKLQELQNCLEMSSMRKNSDDDAIRRSDSGHKQLIKRLPRETISNPNIFPAFRYIFERKRNITRSNSRLRLNEETMQNETRDAPEMNNKGDKGKLGDLEIDSTRRKRETHILTTKYRSKRAIAKRNIRRKRPKPRSYDQDNDNENCDDENGRNKKFTTTPHMFLNVSFTGYWEPNEEVTTVTPRVKNPLKTSDIDMQFVYQTTKKPKGTRTNIKAVVDGNVSKYKIRVETDY